MARASATYMKDNPWHWKDTPGSFHLAKTSLAVGGRGNSVTFGVARRLTSSNKALAWATSSVHASVRASARLVISADPSTGLMTNDTAFVASFCFGREVHWSFE